MAYFLLKVSCVYIASVGFGIIVNLPRKALNVAGVNGVLGWLVYYFIMQFNHDLGLANFAGGVVIGLFSIVISRLKKMPGILFDFPGLVPLVPGGQAYNAIKNFALGNYQEAFNFFSQVIWIAGSIAIGFIVAEICLYLYLKVKRTVLTYQKSR